MTLILATVFAALAALLHVYIFWMEAVAWRRPVVWRRFGVADQESADTMAAMAYNQGFYNLFLALGTLIGLVMLWSAPSGAGVHVAGAVLALGSTASMAAAAAVLLSTGRERLRAAATQGTLPLIAVVLLAVVLLT